MWLSDRDLAASVPINHPGNVDAEGIWRHAGEICGIGSL